MNDQAIWSGDKLGRAASARFLTKYLSGLFASSLVSNTYGSFVLSVSAGWGFGKTYFLSEWAKELEQSGYPIVQFDAWKTDYAKEPLLAFIAELKEQIERFVPTPALAAYRKTFEKGKLVMRGAVPLLAEIT